MCGIMGCSGCRPALPILLTGLERLEYRGYDSAGVALSDEQGITVYKQEGRLTALREVLTGKPCHQTVGMGHTRWATHGAPTCYNAHPHVSEDGRFAVVHNGIIENYAALRARLEEQGVTFRSDTDTEVVAQLLARCYRGDVRQAIVDTVVQLTGAYALGILCADHPGQLFGVRRASPLVVGIGEDGCYLASDVMALLPFTAQVAYPEEGDVLRLCADGVTVWNELGERVSRVVQTATWDAAATDKNGYPHYMLKELEEQPASLTAVILPHLKEGRICLPQLAGFPACGWGAVRRLVIVACGSAYHAGLVGKYDIERLAGLPVEVDLASEFRYRNPPLDGRTLVVAVSQSGETADTLAALREAKRRGAPALAIVNVVGSTIAREAERVLYTEAGPEIAVATTKGYTTQVAALHLLGSFLAAQRGALSRAEEEELTRHLAQLPHVVRKATAVEVEAVARTLSAHERVYFIGRGSAYAVALEGALKMKEISYIGAEGYAAGELKHGTISLVEQGTPVVVLADRDTQPHKTLSNLREVKARGAYTVAVVSADMANAFSEADVLITVPTAPPHLSAIPQAVVLQRLAYRVALLRGCDIDKPRNLAKSVTVE